MKGALLPCLLILLSSLSLAESRSPSRLFPAPAPATQDTIGGWTGEEPVALPDSVADSPSELRFDNQGVPWVVWTRDVAGSGTGGTLFWSRRLGGQWSSPQAVDAGETAAGSARFAFDSQDTAWMVYPRLRSKWEVWSIRGVDGTWSNPERLSPPDTLTYGGATIGIGGGEVWAAWIGTFPGSRIFVTHRVDGQWETPTDPTGGMGGLIWGSQVAVAPDGVPHVIWVNGSTGSLLYSTRSGGVWTPPVTINDPVHSNVEGSCRIVAGDGTVDVVWAGVNDINAGPLDDIRIYYAHKGGSGWSAPVAITEDVGQIDEFPEIRIRGPADMWVTWEHRDSPQADSARALVSRFDGSTLSDLHRLDGGAFPVNDGTLLDLDSAGRPWVVWRGHAGYGSEDAILFSHYVGQNTPVLLSNLRVSSTRDGATLRWQTEPEAFLLFRIDRSGDGDFTEAGRVTAGAEASYSWQERGLAPGTYRYRIAGIRRDGDPAYLGPVSVTVGAPPTRLALQVTGLVRKGGPAVVSIGLPRGGDLRLQAMDVQGRLVSDLDLGPYPPGWHTLTWSPRSGSGGDLVSGIYYLRVALGGDAATGRVVVLR